MILARLADALNPNMRAGQIMWFRFLMGESWIGGYWSGGSQLKTGHRQPDDSEESPAVVPPPVLAHSTHDTNGQRDHEPHKESEDRQLKGDGDGSLQVFKYRPLGNERRAAVAAE